MITRQKSERLQLCLGYRNVDDGMWKNTGVCVWSRDARIKTQRALGFELRRQEQSRGLKVDARRAPEQDLGSLVVLISELLLPGGLLGNGLEAPSALGLGAGGATCWSAFTQVTC